MSVERLLAGDVGGTKTVLALYETGAAAPRPVDEQVFPSSHYRSLGEIVKEFLAARNNPALRAACFGVAGVVVEGRSHATNLPWEIDAREIGKIAGTARVHLLNDLEAAAFGVLMLDESDFAVLNAGDSMRPRGNVAVIAAGTGLGEAILYWDGSRFHPIASEGGHADFAPGNEQEIELLRHLMKQFQDDGGHVSYERVLSGPGLFNIYRFLRDSNFAPEPRWLAEELARSDDPSATVSRAALEKNDPLCVAVLRTFARIYGAEAGNLALRCLARGGVYVCGGIAPKLLSTLKEGYFMEGFLAKGRFKDFMARLPVRVTLNQRAPLIGAAYYAAQLS